MAKPAGVGYGLRAVRLHADRAWLCGDGFENLNVLKLRCGSEICARLGPARLVS